MTHLSRGITQDIQGCTLSAQHDINIENAVNNGLRGIDLLLKASAPGAFHDSGERFDPPKCHPKTRTHILTKIMSWIVGEVGWDGFIMWLYGPAGAGKSAIAQTIAELCHARHLLLASFFFSRTDPKRNNEQSLIASIAYQIAINIPEAREAIEAAVECDPAIFHRSVTVQLTMLIIDPLVQLSETETISSTTVPNLIIIDGLDECHDRQVQQHILHAVSAALQQSSVPLKVLICSRAEPHLTLEFTSPILGEMVTRLSLDDGYEQNADIERYLIDSFHKISTTHPLKAYIPPTWPAHQVISRLVQKSSRQFIYAATVVKYISSDRHQPTRRLEIILGMQTPRNDDRPFAVLDALYIGILSSVEDIKATIRLLGVLILADPFPPTPEVVGEFMFLDSAEVQCLLLDLASVVECVDQDTQIQMLHASFPDFLLDQSRSGEYCIDSSSMYAEISLLYLSHIRMHDSKHWETCLGGSITRILKLDYPYCDIMKHLSHAEPSADLREALLKTDYLTFLINLEKTPPFRPINQLLTDFLSFLKVSKFTNTEELYLYHRNIYDRIINKRIADFSLDFGLIVCLVLIEMEPSLEDMDPRVNMMEPRLDEMQLHLGFMSPFSKVEDGVVRNYSTLYFDPMQISVVTPSYCALLRESLNHPVHAGKYFLDGAKCALVARFFLDCFIEPSPERGFLRALSLGIVFRIFDAIGTLLSKASQSDELVERINHANLIFDYRPISERVFYIGSYRWQRMLSTCINSIGNYLMRVIGSVPTGLRLTAVNKEGETQSYYYEYDTHSIVV